MQEEITYQKAKVTDLEKRKAKWVFATLFLGIFAIIVAAPFVDSAIGANIDQADDVIGVGIGFMILCTLFLYFGRKK